VSDETNIQRLLKNGRPIEYARDYIICGCWCLTVPGRAFDFMSAEDPTSVDARACLEQRRLRVTGRQVGPRTGDPRGFRSYDEVWNAYRRQVEAQFPKAFALNTAAHQVAAQYLALPFQSALLRGVLRRASIF